MNKTIKDLSLTSLALIILLAPVLANAALSFNIANPIKFTTISGLIVGILNILIVIAVPIIVLFIIYAGFLYVTAAGNADQTKQATRSLTYSIIGAVLVLGAVALSKIIANLVSSFAGP